jgi:hypothetical protein
LHLHRCHAHRQHGATRRPVVGTRHLQFVRARRHLGTHHLGQLALLPARVVDDDPVRLGDADQQVRRGGAGGRHPVVDVALAVGDVDDEDAGRQGVPGRLGVVQPAEALLLVGGPLAAVLGVPLEGGVAGPDLLREQADGQAVGAHGQGGV